MKGKEGVCVTVVSLSLSLSLSLGGRVCMFSGFFS